MEGTAQRRFRISPVGHGLIALLTVLAFGGLAQPALADNPGESPYTTLDFDEATDTLFVVAGVGQENNFQIRTNSSNVTCPDDAEYAPGEHCATVTVRDTDPAQNTIFDDSVGFCDHQSVDTPDWIAVCKLP